MKRNIHAHHLKGIENLTKTYENDERFQAIIIGGSVAKGHAREDSDVDFMIVATDEEFHKRQKRVTYLSTGQISQITKGDL